MTKQMTDPVAVFHAHLEGCRQCAMQPFNLCAIGAPLLRAAASAWDKQQPKKVTP